MASRDYPDPDVPGLAIRLMASGYRSWILVARFPLNPKNPTRRVLCRYGDLTRDQVHALAWRWLKLIDQGIDPMFDEARGRRRHRRDYTCKRPGGRDVHDEARNHKAPGA